MEHMQQSLYCSKSDQRQNHVKCHRMLVLDPDALRMCYKPLQNHAKTRVGQVLDQRAGHWIFARVVDRDIDELRSCTSEIEKG